MTTFQDIFYAEQQHFDLVLMDVFATASGLIHSLDCGYFRSIIFV